MNKSANRVMAFTSEAQLQRDRDLRGQDEARKQEAEKLANPNLTAITTQIDSKTVKLKFVKK